MCGRDGIEFQIHAQVSRKRNTAWNLAEASLLDSVARGAASPTEPCRQKFRKFPIATLAIKCEFHVDVRTRYANLGSQGSYSGSGWPRRDAASYFDSEVQLLHLQHRAEDHCKRNSRGEPEGIRAYLPDLLGSLQCHTDVQSSDGSAMLLRYVAGYVAKFSDSFATEWLNDAASDYSIARRVLTDYHPGEPEMVLQLAQQWFPLASSSASMRKFVVPVPWAASDLPKRVSQYMEAKWRPDNMPLADFLRKTNDKGELQRFLRRRHKAEVQAGLTTQSLEAWAATAPMRGEAVTAAVYLSRYNDKYYGQWVIMNVPFRKLEDLWFDELNLIPQHLLNEALAFHHRPDICCDEEAIRAELQLEAFREHHIRNIVAMLQANALLIDKFLAGELDKDRDGEVTAVYRAGDNRVLAPDQMRITNEIVDRVRAGMEERASEAWQDGHLSFDASVFQEASSMRRPAMAVMGPAGSGKSTAVQAAIEESYNHAASVLVVAPTGRLAATYRNKYPHLDVDTIHGAFALWKPEQETLELMMPYDLIVVEELGQLSESIFERLIRLWRSAEQIPALVFVGDFWQLPSVEPRRACHSQYWHSPLLAKRELFTMRRCKCDLLRRKLEILRTAKPSVKQLRFILKGHKAPSRQHRYSHLMFEEPFLQDVQWTLEETPDTTFLTITRSATAKLNELALESLFPNAAPLAVIPADPESNLQNYTANQQKGEAPSRLPLHKGMRVVLTKNLNKPIGFVNGMPATVLGMQNSNVIVRTQPGRVMAIHPWTSESRVMHYPMRIGYSSTLHKVQGATLDHVTVWLDIANCPAAAYVALSRVEYDKNWRFFGNPGVHHFTPAKF